MANDSRGNNLRTRDVIKIESRDDRVEFRNFNSLRISNDLTKPSEAAFDIGDDGTWADIESYVGLGKVWRVFVNSQLRLMGRVEMADIPMDATGGASVRFVVRTKLADAMYASANPAIRVTSTSIKEFILKLFEKLDFTEANFVFQADVSRDLMTGKLSDGTDSPVVLEELKEEQAKVNPPETIYAAADRHLKRHGLMLWDSPDGRIVIGSPNDEQKVLFSLRAYKGSNGAQNNILSATRRRDASGVPSVLCVYGVGGKVDWRKSKVRKILAQQEIYQAGFFRPVIIVNEGLKTDSLAERFANAEMTARLKNFDAWDIVVDGLSFWTGSESIPYGIDTVCDVHSDMAGGPTGAYLLHHVELSRDVTGADTARLSLLRKGLWSL